jgi:hypothetical protein
MKSNVVKIKVYESEEQKEREKMMFYLIIAGAALTLGMALTLKR